MRKIAIKPIFDQCYCTNMFKSRDDRFYLIICFLISCNIPCTIVLSMTLEGCNIFKWWNNCFICNWSKMCKRHLSVRWFASYIFVILLKNYLVHFRIFQIGIITDDSKWIIKSSLWSNWWWMIFQCIIATFEYSITIPAIVSYMFS